MIKAKNICKSFGQLQVLKGVDIEVADGEFVSIIGASGAGKTTLLQIIGTLDTPDDGSLEVDGTNVLRLRGNALADFRNKHVGFVFQFHQLLPEFTALENVQIPALIARRNKKEAEAEAKEILCRLGLENRLDHKPAALSGGEKQRVAVARALINKPRLILADEPSGSLDSKNKEEMHKLLLSLKQELGLTVLVVTHDQSLAAVSDRVVEMKDGLIISD
ncbi:MAG: ABC transporter ATP-binding protein [Bacteroidetes bacterium]|uniref:ABC transporter ATP-binding protein n=1 Tax=Candidatus Enterocola intestinipullorum TaxID=2840783 RepID=A0A9D9EFR3_9BACT|nr:ABC transporter ATP-binding protein [Candidatus Enterocola intestinipullorum]